MRPILAFLIGLAACGGGPRRTPGDEYLKAIRFEGNAKLKSKTLLAGLALDRTQERGGAPDPYLVEVDADRIRGEYLRKGFLDVDVRARVERAGDAATVIYTVDEGERATTRVEIAGIPDDPALPVAKLRAALPLADGAPFDYAVYDAAKQRLLAIAENAGYAHATLDATVFADRRNAEAVVRLEFSLGPKSRFGETAITGVTGELADAVRARLDYEPGDSYSISAIAATQRALYALGRFSTVQVMPSERSLETRSPVIEMRVAVTEAPGREVRLGGGLGMDPTAFEVRGRAGYTVAGWPFPLDTATLDLQPAYARLRESGGYQPRIRALARLERQDLFWPYAVGSVEAGYNYVTIEAYTSYGPRARLGFSTPLGTRRVQLRAGWSFERLQFRMISPLIDPALAAELAIDDVQRVGTYEQALVVDLRDHPIEPTRGAYGDLRLLEGTRFAGGGFEFFELVPELRGFVPIGPVVLAARARGGAIWGDVPATERFFSGGASRHRGFGERRLAPFVAGEVDGEEQVVPYGGVAVLETGLEARVPITTWREIGIGGVVFLDGGDVRERVGDLDPGNLHWAAGVGVRFRTIVGPIRADFGYRLNRTGPMEPAPDSRYAFHISLGEAF